MNYQNIVTFDCTVFSARQHAYMQSALYAIGRVRLSRGWISQNSFIGTKIDDDLELL